MAKELKKKPAAQTSPLESAPDLLAASTALIHKAPLIIGRIPPLWGYASATG
jgi:hypothetical protein